MQQTNFNEMAKKAKKEDIGKNENHFTKKIRLVIKLIIRLDWLWQKDFVL